MQNYLYYFSVLIKNTFYVEEELKNMYSVGEFS